MKLDSCPTVDEAVKQLQRLRSYMPYKYSGTWFVSAWNNVGYCYRSQQALINAARRSDCTSIDIVKLSPAQQA